MAKRPKMPNADPDAGARFRTWIPADPRVTVRPMFGHTAAFVNGHMFAGTFGEHVFVRLDERSRGELLAAPGATPFAPMKDRPMKEYVQLPPRMLSEAATVTTWIARALQWTSTLPAKMTGHAKPRTTGRKVARKHPLKRR